MNLKELIAKMTAIEEGAPVAPTHTDAPADQEGIIIGSPMGAMMGHSEAPHQQDNVTMSVNLNGQGTGGVRDLMNILKDIEQSSDHDQDDRMQDMLFGAEEKQMYDGYENSQHGHDGATTFGIDSITHHGDDMHKGSAKEPHKKHGGGNPYKESLEARLSRMYQEIKEAAKPTPFDKSQYDGDREEPAGSKSKPTPKGELGKTLRKRLGEPEKKVNEADRTMSRAAKGYEKYGKKGMTALAKAGREGKDLDKVRDKFNKYKDKS